MTTNVTISSVGHIKTQEELDNNTELKTLLELDSYLRENGFCYVEVLEGDYKGSVAKFNVTKEYMDTHSIVPRHSFYGGWNIKSHWSGKLSWTGKRNNPKFMLWESTAQWLKDYSGETKLVKLDLKRGAKELLENYHVTDIDGEEICIDDKVLYINLRYGCGGKLCRGQVVELKPHVRSESISVVVRNEDKPEELSDLKYPHMQILVIQ